MSAPRSGSNSRSFPTSTPSRITDGRWRPSRRCALRAADFGRRSETLPEVLSEHHADDDHRAAHDGPDGHRLLQKQHPAEDGDKGARIDVCTRRRRGNPREGSEPDPVPDEGREDSEECHRGPRVESHRGHVAHEGRAECEYEGDEDAGRDQEGPRHEREGRKPAKEVLAEYGVERG